MRRGVGANGECESFDALFDGCSIPLTAPGE
jgi:hypothetical protein